MKDATVMTGPEDRAVLGAACGHEKQQMRTPLDC